MRNRILKYLNEHFTFFVEKDFQVKLFDKTNDERIHMMTLCDELNDIFDDLNLVKEVINEWYDNEGVKLDNLIVDISYDLCHTRHDTNVSSYHMGENKELILEKLGEYYPTYLNTDTRKVLK